MSKRKGNYKINSGSFKKGMKLSEETKRKIVKALTGREVSEETKRKLSVKHKDRVREGKNNLYKGGISKTNIALRSSLEYRLWRKSVFERDKYTCVWCGKKGVRLNADHIKPFALFPELRFAIDNGRTLCVPCHRKTGTFGRLTNYHEKFRI